MKLLISISKSEEYYTLLESNKVLIKENKFLREKLKKFTIIVKHLEQLIPKQALASKIKVTL